MSVGRITFGPVAEVAARPDRWRPEYTWGVPALNFQPSTAQPCNCIGPQPGQTKCPCALRAESEQGAAMVREGVTINGRRYRLVPEDAP